MMIFPLTLLGLLSVVVLTLYIGVSKDIRQARSKRKYSNNDK